MEKPKEIIDDKVYRILIDFAKKYSKKVKAVFKGRDPEEEETVYYFIGTSKKYDSGFSDKLASLELKIFNKFGENVPLMCWPRVNPDDYGFFGKCLYKNK